MILVKKRLTFHGRGFTGVVSYGDIDQAIGQFRVGLITRKRTGGNAQIGGSHVKNGEQFGQDRRHNVIGCAKSEDALLPLGQEGPVGQHIGLDIGEYACNWLGKVQGARGRAHRAAHANQQWIAEQIAKPAQRMAHSGLANPDTPGGAADAALDDQRIQSHQQVQVE